MLIDCLFKTTKSSIQVHVDEYPKVLPYLAPPRPPPVQYNETINIPPEHHSQVLFLSTLQSNPISNPLATPYCTMTPHQ